MDLKSILIGGLGMYAYLRSTGLPPHTAETKLRGLLTPVETKLPSAQKPSQTPQGDRHGT